MPDPRHIVNISSTPITGVSVTASAHGLPPGEDWSGTTDYSRDYPASQGRSIEFLAPQTVTQGGTEYTAQSGSHLFTVTFLSGVESVQSKTITYAENPDPTPTPTPEPLPLPGLDDLEGYLDFPDIPPYLEGSVEVSFSGLQAADLSSMADQLKAGNMMVEMVDVVGGESGVIKSLKPVRIGGTYGSEGTSWAILSDIATSGMITIDSVKFSSHDEIENTKKAFVIPGWPSGENNLAHWLSGNSPLGVCPDVDAMGTMGMAAGEWGEGW